MYELTLTRYAHRKTHTLGMIHLDGVFLMYTLELPHRYNRRWVSRIPKGTYEVVKVDSTKYEVLHVPERENILIHVGNWSKDTVGCILVGMGQRDDMITNSADALEWLGKWAGDKFTLHIRDL